MDGIGQSGGDELLCGRDAFFAKLLDNGAQGARQDAGGSVRVLSSCN
jgi:hypothetical protein